MLLGQSKLALVVMVAILVTSVVAAPAAAYSPSGFESNVRCFSRTVSTTPWEIELRRLLVAPPKIDAISSQMVGWRFIVQRGGNNNDWSRTYRSPVQRSMGAAAFTAMGAKVAVPAWTSPDHLRSHPYRVVIKVFWYRADGSIKATAKSPVFEYGVWIDGALAWPQTAFCYGRERNVDAEAPDGEPPTVPSDLRGSAGLTGEARLSWTASTDDRPGELNYDVLRNGMVIARVANTEHVDFRGGVVASNYDYTVQAVDGAGNRSASSAEVDVAVNPALFPFAGVVSRYGDRTRPRVALTFDDCVRIANVKEIVRILRANNAAASFFCRGDQLGAGAAVFGDLARDFPLLNHGWSHTDLDMLTPSQIIDEITTTTTSIESATGRPMPPIMRPPYGRANLTTRLALTEVGVRIVNWDIDTRDWQAGVTWEMVRDTALTSRNGSIVLMHDHTTTVNALPSIISGLRSRGFELVTVTELLNTAWQPAGG